jgi:hypothetical protein
MSVADRFATMAVTSLELPGTLARAMERPVVVLRARRGGRRRFERLVASFGERAVQILDADGYLLLVVEDARELRRMISSALVTAESVDITAWDRRGEPVPIEKGIE